MPAPIANLGFEFFYMPDVAVIFAAGLGSRMKELTKNKPKALVHACDYTLIDLVIRQITAAGIKSIAVNVHYHARQVIDHLHGYDDKIHLTIIEEPELLETGGSLLNILHILDHRGPILTCNVDTIWAEHRGGTPQLKRLLDTWQQLPKNRKLLMMVSDRLHGGPPTYDFELVENSEAALADTIGTKKGGHTTPAMPAARLRRAESARHHYVGSQIIDPIVLDNHANKHAFSLSQVYQGLSDCDGFLQDTYAVEFDGLDIFHVGDETAVQLLIQYYNNNQALNW